MDVKTELANVLGTEKASLLNIPNAQTQAAMRDADAWIVEMRAKESQNMQSNASLHSENLNLKI
jgi:hypothetical protein